MRFRAFICSVSLTMVAGAVAIAAPPCGSAPGYVAPTFSTPTLLDTVRAGGEPSIQPMPDGTLVYSAHAGTTHLLKGRDPTDFALGYDGTVNTWRSTDMGATWDQVQLLEQTTGAPLPQGFSDPSTAVDAAGNVYLAAIDTATVYVGRSADGAEFVGNKLAAFNMDREWLAADTDGLLYMKAAPFGGWPTQDGLGAEILWRSTNGGESWEDIRGRSLPSGGSSPILVNPRDGALLWPRSQPGQGSWPTNVRVFPDARSGDLDSYFDAFVGAGLPAYGGFITASAADDAGNLYIASNTYGTVQVATSTDGGRTWSSQVVARTPGEMRWPWIAAGADGRVAVAWLERAAGTDDWRVEVATSVTAHGWTDACDATRAGVWHISRLTSAPMHRGSICANGLSCNTSINSAGDRRLGDYFTIAITTDGRLVAAFGETASDPGSIISHPAFVSQTGGLDFRP